MKIADRSEEIEKGLSALERVALVAVVGGTAYGFYWFFHKLFGPSTGGLIGQFEQGFSIVEKDFEKRLKDLLGLLSGSTATGADVLINDINALLDGFKKSITTQKQQVMLSPPNLIQQALSTAQTTVKTIEQNVATLEQRVGSFLRSL